MLEILTGSGAVLHIDRNSPAQLEALTPALEVLGGSIAQRELNPDEVTPADEPPC